MKTPELRPVKQAMLRDAKAISMAERMRSPPLGAAAPSPPPKATEDQRFLVTIYYYLLWAIAGLATRLVFWLEAVFAGSSRVWYMQHAGYLFHLEDERI